MNPTDENEEGGKNPRPETPTAAHSVKGTPPLDTMRAYRACLNCRNRKSKCDLDLNGGKPVSAIIVASVLISILRPETLKINISTL